MGAPAEAKKVGDCEDKAYFSFFVDQAKQKGVPQDLFLKHLKEIVKDHPELNVPEDSYKEMETLARIAYAFPEWDVGVFYDGCMKHKNEL